MTIAHQPHCGAIGEIAARLACKLRHVVSRERLKPPAAATTHARTMNPLAPRPRPTAGHRRAVRGNPPREGRMPPLSAFPCVRCECGTVWLYLPGHRCKCGADLPDSGIPRFRRRSALIYMRFREPPRRRSAAQEALIASVAPLLLFGIWLVAQ